MMRKIFISLAILLVGLTIHAQTTYYIDPAGSDGSGNGSIKSPWKSLFKACNSVTTSGSIIHVNAGTYKETLRANLAVGVSIEGEGITSIIKTSYIPNQENDAAIWLNSSPGPIDGNQSISYLKIDGDNLTSLRAIIINYRNNVEIHHVTIVDFKYSAIRFNGNNSPYPKPPTVAYSTGNKIHDCISNNNSTTWGYQMSIYGQEGFLLYNNTLVQTTREIGKNGVLIGGNCNKAFKFYNNIFTKNDQEAKQWNFFIELWHLQGGCEIYNNTFHGAAVVDLCDIRKEAYDYGVKMYNNDFLVSAQTTANYNEVQAIDFEDHGVIEYVYVYDNHFKNVPNGIWIDALVNEGESEVNVNHIYFYSNLFENIGCTDNGSSNAIWINGYGSDPNIIWDNISIYNNTMTAGQNIRANAGIKWNTVGAATNISIKNNIIQGFAAYPIQLVAGITGATVDTISVENNLYYSNGTNSVNWGPVSVTNITEQNNKIGNPLFVSSSDFHLQAGSPAINAGIEVGLPYYGSAPDIGAFIYSAATTKITTDIVKGGPFCAGTSISIPYSVTGTFNAENVFTAELSDASGSFTSATSIGMQIGTIAGTITAIIPGSAMQGTDYRIRVKGSNPSTTGSNNGINITVNSLPAIAGTISGPAIVCQGQNLVTYTVPAIISATSYIWTLPTDATGTSSTNSITINYGSFATFGNITVKGNNLCGDGATSSLPIVVTTKPSTPTITQKGNALYSDAINDNQWYNQNGLINGATAQNYSSTIDGDYYSVVTIAGCSSDASNIIHVEVTGIDIIANNNNSIKVYPNPVAEELNIEIKDNKDSSGFEIIDINGQIVFKGILSEKTVVQTTNFSPGVYLIKLENHNTVKFEKIRK